MVTKLSYTWGAFDKEFPEDPESRAFWESDNAGHEAKQYLRVAEEFYVYGKSLREARQTAEREAAEKEVAAVKPGDVIELDGDEYDPPKPRFAVLDDTWMLGIRGRFKGSKEYLPPARMESEYRKLTDDEVRAPVPVAPFKAGDVVRVHRGPTDGRYVVLQDGGLLRIVGNNKGTPTRPRAWSPPGYELVDGG